MVSSPNLHFSLRGIFFPNVILRRKQTQSPVHPVEFKSQWSSVLFLEIFQRDTLWSNAEKLTFLDILKEMITREKTESAKKNGKRESGSKTFKSESDLYTTVEPYCLSPSSKHQQVREKGQETKPPGRQNGQ